jgi:hypothetical protein
LLAVKDLSIYPVNKEEFKMNQLTMKFNNRSYGIGTINPTIPDGICGIFSLLLLLLVFFYL